MRTDPAPPSTERRLGSGRLAAAFGAIAIVHGAYGRRGGRYGRAAVGLLGLDIVGNAPEARRILRQTVRAAAEREAQQAELAAARLGRSLGAAHQPLSNVQPDLEAVLRVLGAGPWTPAARTALVRLGRIGGLLERSRPLRDALADDNGALPVIGGHAAHVPHRRGDPLKLYGRRDAAPESLPASVRRALRHIGVVLDEIRLLHTAEIERSVLVYTLVARAALVCCAPVLGRWSAAPSPLDGLGTARDAVWAPIALVSLATAARARGIAELAMRDDPEGWRMRRRLLALEVPLAVAGLLLAPSWTVAVFAAGWTNWWQRQTPGLEFDWIKLGAFVVVVAGLQQLGLAWGGVAPSDAVGESVLTLAAILAIGASYGVMLPLAVATAVGVVAGDTRRSLAAARRAREELIGCARALDAVSDRLDPVAVDAPVAERAAATARQAALQLERAADRAGRGGLLASHLLDELIDEAAVRSFLPRRDSRAHERAAAAAEQSGESPPAFFGGATFAPRPLRTAHVRAQLDARRLRRLIEWALNEARRHGTGSVRVVMAIEDDRLSIRVGNRPRDATGASGGLAGEGAGELGRLARRLDGGRADQRGPAPPATIGMPDGPEWWVVAASCSASILADDG